MRIVVKIGSSSLTSSQNTLDMEKMQDHVDSIAALKQAGHEVILVSSGAVAAGYKLLGYPARPVTLKGKQAAAAVGQSVLIQAYTQLFAQYQLVPAQLLLTRSDFTHKKRYQNAYETISELLERSIIPIINENDTVSIAELAFGDNDMLSSLVAGLMHADLLVLLTDVNGLYTDNPIKNPMAKQIRDVEEITTSMFQGAQGSSSKVGTGGMESKLTACQYAMENGIDAFIGNGKGKNKLLQIVQNNGDGTYFHKQNRSVPNTKRWVSLTEVSGRVSIDYGAYKALIEGQKSLLLAGIIAFEGHFDSGEVVEVYFEDNCIGRGEIVYSSDGLRENIGKNKEMLTVKTSVAIHRDTWVKK